MKSIQININLIKAETGKAILVKLPKEDYCFWHPKKLVKEGKNSSTLTLLLFDGVTQINKYGQGKYNKRTILKTRYVDTDEMIDIFSNITKNTQRKSFHDDFETHTPKEKKPIESKANKELEDD